MRIRTASGRMVDPINLTPGDVIVPDLIHSISMLTRFHGHTKHPYTVGQHTLNLIWIVPEYLKKAALIHDLSEAWFNDLASPLKREFPNYRFAEHNASLLIAKTLGVSSGNMCALKSWDSEIYINERDALFTKAVLNLGVGMHDDLAGLEDTEGLMNFDFADWTTTRQELMSWYSCLFPRSYLAWRATK